MQSNYLFFKWLFARKREKLDLTISTDSTTQASNDVPVPEIRDVSEISLDKIVESGFDSTEEVIKAPEKTLVEEDIRPTISETPVSKSNYQKYPEWYGASLKMLQDLRIKKDLLEIAKKVKPNRISSIRSRLEQEIGQAVALVFIRFYPQAFKFSDDNLQTYLQNFKYVSSFTEYLTRLGHTIPKELAKKLDWKRNHSSFSSVEALSQLILELDNFKREYDVENSLPIKDLEVYYGKRILFIGVWKHHHKEALRENLGNELSFQSGKDLRGIDRYTSPVYDVIVFSGGTHAHQIDQKLKYIYGDDFKKKVIYAFNATNHKKILEVMAHNAYKFR